MSTGKPKTNQKAHDVQDKLCHVKQKAIIKTAKIKIMKRCKQRNKDGGIECYIFWKKVKDSLNQIVKQKKRGQNSNHEVFTFLMVHCLVISIQKNMEWAYWNEYHNLNTEYTCFHRFTPINVQQIFNKIPFLKKRFASNMKTKHLTQPL